jgi:hypothetical protein
MIVEKQAGFPVAIISVANVKPNVTIAAQMRRLQVHRFEAAAVQSEKIADGVYLLERPAHHSVAIEFNDHVAIVEAPLNDSDRSPSSKKYENSPRRNPYGTSSIRIPHFDQAAA